MRNLKKVLLAMLFVVGAVFLAPKDAKAATTVQMTKTGRNSLTIEWQVPNVNNIVGYYVKDTSSGKYVFSAEGNYRGVEFTKLSPGFVSRFEVYYVYNNGNGNVERYLVSTYVNTTHSDISTKNFGLSNVSSGGVDFIVYKPTNATKVELEVYNAKNKRVSKQTMYKYSNRVKLSKGMAYKYRVRAYYTNDSTKKTYYGNWSNYRYFGYTNATIKSAKKSLKVSIKKGTGISSYTVYVSTKKNSGFKKVKTFKVGKKSKYSTTIKKYGKKKIKGGSSYYVKIVPKVKFGSKTYSSDMVAQSSAIYVRRY